MLLVLVGARGAGKTTLLETLRQEGVKILKPSTTRKPRYPSEEEYDFVDEWRDELYAWAIPVKMDTYGMRHSELDRVRDGVSVTVFEPLNLSVFEAVRDSLACTSLTVGLATIADVAEQRQRVAGDPQRLMDEATFERVEAIVLACDVVLTGDAEAVAAAMRNLVADHGGQIEGSPS
jgi:ribose 1,5-bisphosphokinase PhnN